MSIEKNDNTLYIFYEEKRDRYKCVIKGKYIASSVDFDVVVEARDKYLSKNNIQLVPVGISLHPNGIWMYRRSYEYVRYEIYTSANKEKVLKAKEIFDGRIQSKEISLSKVQEITNNGDEPDRRTVRGVPKNSVAIWGNNFLHL